MLPLLLSLHLLSPLTSTAPQLRLLPSRPATPGQAALARPPGDLALGHERLYLHLLETAIGGTAVVISQAGVVYVGALLVVWAQALGQASPTAGLGLLALVLGVELLGLPVAGMLAVGVVGDSHQDPGSWGAGYFGALLGNLLGLPVGAVALYTAVKLNGAWPTPLLVVVGLVFQGLCVALGASIGQHWGRTPPDERQLPGPAPGKAQPREQPELQPPAAPGFGRPLEPPSGQVLPVFTVHFG